MSSHTLTIEKDQDTSFEASVRALLRMDPNQAQFVDPSVPDESVSKLSELQKLITESTESSPLMRARPIQVRAIDCDKSPCLLTLSMAMAGFVGLFMFIGGIASSIRIAESQEPSRKKILKISLSASLAVLAFVLMWSLLTGLQSKALDISKDDQTSFIFARLGISLATSSVIFFLATVIARQLGSAPKLSIPEAYSLNQAQLPNALRMQLEVYRALTEKKQTIKTETAIEKNRLALVTRLLEAHIEQRLKQIPSTSITSGNYAETALTLYPHSTASKKGVETLNSLDL